jgi:hypothetical protein
MQCLAGRLIERDHGSARNERREPHPLLATRHVMSMKKCNDREKAIYQKRCSQG